METCVDGRFERCEVSQYGDYGQRVDYCLGAVYDGSIVADPRSEDDGRSEAIHVAHSTATTIDRPRVYTCRLGIGLSNGCFGVEITDPVIRGASERAIATHGDSITAGGIRLDGVAVEAETDTDGIHPEECLSSLNAREAATIRGTTIHWPEP